MVPFFFPLFFWGGGGCASRGLGVLTLDSGDTTTSASAWSSIWPRRSVRKTQPTTSPCMHAWLPVCLPVTQTMRFHCRSHRLRVIVEPPQPSVSFSRACYIYCIPAAFVAIRKRPICKALIVQPTLAFYTGRDLPHRRALSGTPGPDLILMAGTIQGLVVEATAVPSIDRQVANCFFCALDETSQVSTCHAVNRRVAIKNCLCGRCVVGRLALRIALSLFRVSVWIFSQPGHLQRTKLHNIN